MGWRPRLQPLSLSTSLTFQPWPIRRRRASDEVIPAAPNGVPAGSASPFRQHVFCVAAAPQERKGNSPGSASRERQIVRYEAFREYGPFQKNCNILSTFRSGKEDRPLSPERPAGCCAQKGSVPFPFRLAAIRLSWRVLRCRRCGRLLAPLAAYFIFFWPAAMKSVMSKPSG